MSSNAWVEPHDFESRRVQLEELIRSKRSAPLRSFDDLRTAGVFPSDDEVDEFVSSVREWRRSDLG